MITKDSLFLLFVIALVVFFYIYRLGSFSFSSNHADWGAFGSYFGGILSPIIAVLVLRFIVKTYNLQKIELQELKDAQKKQLKLASDTALLNSNLTYISVLQAEASQLLRDVSDLSGDNQLVGRVQSLSQHFSCNPESVDFEDCLEKERERFRI